MRASLKNTIAVVGRPNVGKSSLFNALLGYRRTIVLDKPGTTMDEIMERVKWGKSPLFLVDSQGVFDEGDKRVLDALLPKADHVVFVVDALVGPTPFDRWVAKLLHSAKKNVLLVVNKVDAKQAYTVHDFAELGFKTAVEVSASHRRNIDSVRQWCLAQVLGESFLKEEETETTEKSGETTSEPLRVALVGRPNTGKSTLMNGFAGTLVSRVSPIPHTTRDPVCHEVETPQGRVYLLDTAGVRRPRSKKDDLEIFSIQASTRAITKADVVFLVLNASEPITDQDMRLLNLVTREGKPTLVLLNFWDKLGASQRKHFLADSDFSSYLKQFKTLPVSGLTGWNLQDAFPQAFRMWKQTKKRVKTSRLNQLVERLIQKNPPPAMGGQNFNILYASQVGKEPPSFVFFMNRKGNLPPSYQKYLENGLRKALNLKSQPIRLFFRGQKEA